MVKQPCHLHCEVLLRNKVLLSAQPRYLHLKAASPGLHVYTILEMAVLQSWRTDWWHGVRNGDYWGRQKGRAASRKALVEWVFHTAAVSSSHPAGETVLGFCKVPSQEETTR